MLGDHSFALCLTHDVDRPYKTYQSLYYAVRRGDPRQLGSALGGRNTFWRFDEIMALEDAHGVRSAFYFLDEQRLLRDRPPSSWLRPASWRLYAGRYSLSDPDIVDLIERLDKGGWEVGLHGSYESYRDRGRLADEKATLERVLGHPVRGGRQHYLNLEIPSTWRHHVAIGLDYDASLGTRRGYGFQFGYRPLRPFDDSFLVLPLTIMESRLPDPGTAPDAAWRACESLLEEARANGAVMTILWHPCYFSEFDFPGYAGLYERIIEQAQSLGAWVGPPAQLVDRLEPEAVARGRPSDSGLATPPPDAS